MYTVIHELGHVIGLVHEMERADRDFYIDVHFENMNEASVRNFYTTKQKNMTYNLYGTPYNYKSIMHYPPKVTYNLYGTPYNYKSIMHYPPKVTYNGH